MIDSKTILFLRYASIIAASFQNFINKSILFIIARTFVSMIWIIFSTISFWCDVYDLMSYNARSYFFI